jgi:hypothetical protein
VRFLFANPADVAYADQAAAALPGTIVRVRVGVPLGVMYLVREERLRDAAHGVELKRIAEEVIEVEAPSPPGAQ